jgi:hypothetical protein
VIKAISRHWLRLISLRHMNPHRYPFKGYKRRAIIFHHLLCVSHCHHGCGPHSRFLACKSDHKCCLWSVHTVRIWTLISPFVTGIAFSLFFTSINIIRRKRQSTGQLNLPLVIPSVLIFVLATVVSFMLLGSGLAFGCCCHFQNVAGLWMNMYMALAVHGKNPELYLQLIRTPAKLVMQVGQVGAIVLADALVVRCFCFIYASQIFTIFIGLPCIHYMESQLLDHIDTLYDFRGDFQ